MSKKKRDPLLLIVNPEAGNPPDPERRTRQAVEMLVRQGFEVDLAVERKRHSAAKIARRAVQAGYKTIVVMGGDRTIEEAARWMVGHKTRLGILRDGMEINIARCLGIPEDLADCAQLIHTGEVRKIDVGQIETRETGRRYFFEIAAVGLAAELFPQAKALYKQRWNQVVGALSGSVDYQTPLMTIKMDGGSIIEASSDLVTVSNMPTFGAQYLLAPNARLSDGLLDVNFYSNLSKTEILRYFALASYGRSQQEPSIERYRTGKITIRASPKQAVMADGIILGRGKARIQVLKGALRVIMGDNGLGQEDIQIKQEGQVPYKTPYVSL